MGGGGGGRETDRRTERQTKTDRRAKRGSEAERGRERQTDRDSERERGGGIEGERECKRVECTIVLAAAVEAEPEAVAATNSLKGLRLW